ncbi:hypothetical protein [Methylocapsa acidiphila]|uniref:hypothetical protein n=1 Tax=Methylocapsa acidiphila TaxID=133552 RepID=UPI0003FD39F7|nr:hypothetical protein [Methylocapsa acidiphila]
MRLATLLFRATFAASLTAGAAAISTDTVNAAPLTVAPLGSNDAPMIDKAYWTSRCRWVPSPWGPQRRCRRVWVGGGGPGWGPPPPLPPPGPGGWGPPPPPPPPGPGGWGPPPPPPPPPGW